MKLNNQHRKMIVGGIVDEDFSVIFDPMTSTGSETRRIVEIAGFDDVAIALYEEGAKNSVIERIVSTEEYESIDKNEFLYNGLRTIQRLAAGKQV